MVRPKKTRFISHKPVVNVFKPTGIPMSEMEIINLTLDEFEALRLVDSEQMDHESAAELVGVSRPTLTRLIEKARKKVADCIIYANALSIEGGNVEIVSHGRCRSCGSLRPGHGRKLNIKKCCEGDDK